MHSSILPNPSPATASRRVVALSSLARALSSSWKPSLEELRTYS